MTDDERALLKELEYLRDHVAQLSSSDGYLYCNMHDFVLQQGRWFSPQPLPAGVTPRLPTFCYANASALHRRTKGALRYVEGFALSARGTVHQHAWCADYEDQVVDPTWCSPATSGAGLAYLGLPFRLMLNGRRRRRLPIIDDWQHGFPILKHQPQQE
jgi:hypothetical protein